MSHAGWQEPADLRWIDRLPGALGSARSDFSDWTAVKSALSELARSFDALMAFDLHYRLVTDGAVRTRLQQLRDSLRLLRDRAAAELEQNGRTDEMERLHESLSDYHWQVDWEVLHAVDRTVALLPDWMPAGETARQHHFLAWSVEQVLESLEKLEVRGRDSAGISIACVLEPGADPVGEFSSSECDELAARRSLALAQSGHVLLHRLRDGRSVCRFLYKVANPVGKLGDNANALRRDLRGDRLLWRMLPSLERLNVLVHTRWASNGVINIPNCHPVDGRDVRNLAGSEGADGDVLYVLNGDVDNYRTLVEMALHSQGASIHPAISTDAKILPVLFHLETDQAEPIATRFRSVLLRAEGSLAVAMQHPEHPDSLYLGQKGSGQSLYAGRMADGWAVASELYGLAARCRTCYPIAATERGGLAVALWNDHSEGTLRAQYVGGGEPCVLEEEKIAIFSRDIYRGTFDYYIDKEIHEAPQSIRKTLLGKYRKQRTRIEFLIEGFGNGAALLDRLRSNDLPPIRRIVCVGQGTASIAAMGVAHVLRKALESTGVSVESTKASELFGFLPDRPLNDVLLIAVSQSGTTTDTNRVVDLARIRGAWVHAIVNRRDSPLIRKSDSHLYTSNGRDVEMSVASTKAYYSQVAAGKLLALLLASEWKTLPEELIYSEILALESLPEKVEEVLSAREAIAQNAAKYGPASRYWALVGNGANRIAAEEIRIKLSELCYKAIPCDITEDKKHIDLSTEPLTIVVANDLPEAVVQDTAKEVAIFKAHNGRPLVFCAWDEHHFDVYAEELIRLPRVGAGLDFVVATAAGHLWGIEAAKAIDQEAGFFRELRAALTVSLDDPARWDRDAILAQFDEVLERVEKGRTDSALPARAVGALSRYVRWLQGLPASAAASEARLSEAINIVNKIIEEMSRPIDTIRHQAKTVTVGISRPSPGLSTVLTDSLNAFNVTLSTLKEKVRQLLEAVSPLVSHVEGAVFYSVTDAGSYDSATGNARIQAVKAFGISRIEESRYASPQLAAGTKHRVLRTGAAQWTTGSAGDESVLILPIHKDEGWNCSHLVLLHLQLVPRASVDQKLDLLRHLGTKLDDLREQVEEKALSLDFREVVERSVPYDLIFSSVPELMSACTESPTRKIQVAELS